MTKQEILNAFLQAEKDWSEPIERAFENDTNCGLCYYFRNKQCIDNVITYDYLRPYWSKYQTVFGRTYHFSNDGDQPQGRAERLEAIRKVINDLKNELNENH